jgi:putative peptidoglycan lipid II flippase
MSRSLKSASHVTILIILGQALGFVSQIVTAALFGADKNMDAFLAANAVPQYIMAVLIGSLSMVLVPVFIDYIRADREDEAWKIACSVINLSLLLVGVVTVIGIVFPGEILRLTTPGLPNSTHSLAVTVALITWPGMLAIALIPLLTGIYQSQLRFGWPAAVPVLGAAANLLFIVVFSSFLGILGLAVAITFGLVLQAILLLPIVLRGGRYRLSLDWRHPGVVQVLTLLVPLLLANVLCKATPILERFLASSMSEGSISHLNYAFRLSGAATILVSTGITTVMFPRLAYNVASNDMAAFKQSMSYGLRFMWLILAPVIALGVALAEPLVSAAFLRGKFNAADAQSVARILRIYLLSLAGTCLGNITGRSFYALKDTRTIAVIGSIESVAYVFYTYYLSRALGVTGVAWGYVAFFNISLLWQAIVLRYRTGNVGGSTIINSFSRIGLSAVVAGTVAWGLSTLVMEFLFQLILCGSVGIAVYVGAVFVFRVPEARVLWSTVSGSPKY